MKPSDIIEAKTKKFLKEHKLNPMDLTLLIPIQIQSMLDYLDEEYEKKSCERGMHEWIDSDMGERYRECKKCHIVSVKYKI